ncbi:MAG: hypothetical protein ACOY3Y_18960 [Acidobacteriota bacterium]
MIARRAGWIGLALAAGAGVALVALDKPVTAFVLTFTAAVGIINSLWLERLFLNVLQPGRPRVSRRALVLLIARLGLWGLLFAVLVAVRDRVELWAVAAGMGCFLVALACAGLKHADPGEE